ncbi:MAG: hypothetical protein II865_10335 [Bacteroidales bacterium]|nr:hypothetical protein [Bacteroidales bacterium]
MDDYLAKQKNRLMERIRISELKDIIINGKFHCEPVWETDLSKIEQFYFEQNDYMKLCKTGGLSIYMVSLELLQKNLHQEILQNIENDEYVDSYALQIVDDWNSRKPLSPILLNIIDEKVYPVDGRHRLYLALKADIPSIPFVVCKSCEIKMNHFLCLCTKN